MLSPPDYSHDFLIYVVTSQEMIGMVLVQEDEELHEHVIYYVSRSLIDVKLRYTHVEKLALATICSRDLSLATEQEWIPSIYRTEG